MHRNDTTGLIMRIGLFAVITLALVIKSHAQEPIKTLEHETGFYYTVKKGDTLWDISQHFNDTPWLWPELWKENDQISNPHWIYPGERIRLYHGLGESNYQEQQTQEDQTPKMPPLEAPIPEAIPSQKSLEPIVTEKYVYFAKMNQVGFIRKEPVETTGRIFKAQGEKEMISTGDTVYIQPQGHSSDSYIPGSRHTVFRTFAPTRDKKSIERIGAQYYLLGVIEITKNEPKYSVAKVIDIYREIRINDQLMPYVQRPKQIPIVAPTEGIEGQIIVSEEHNELMGENTIAFIDKGKKDKMFAGQNYEIYYRMDHRSFGKKKDNMMVAPIKIGSFVILHTENETSTVLIYDSSQKISAGEKFRASNSKP
jgi:hypothetical protein